MYAFPRAGERRGVPHPEVIDLLTHDARSGQVELVMFEARPWSGDEAQLFELQEKMNAYLSFALDGEFAETYPQLVGKPLRRGAVSLDSALFRKPTCPSTAA